jgi:5-methylcytosine-specific restriction endonuclease McrA
LRCGETFRAQKRKNVKGQPTSWSEYCSRTCWNEDRTIHRVIYTVVRTIWECAECGTNFESNRQNVKLCSPECRRRRSGRFVLEYYHREYARLGHTPDSMLNRSHRRRDRVKATEDPSAPKITKMALGDRDKWRCKLCGKPVPKPGQQKSRGMMASIDHIIPLSDPASPGHLWRNVQLAHLRCNVSKGNRTVPLGEQLLLVG